MFRGLKLLLPLLAVVVVAAPARAASQEVSPPASEWRGYCSAYVAALDGKSEVSDLDVTYCLGMTKGLLNGLRIGAQIGALSFGSRIAVRYQIDPDEVFKLFQQQDPGRILGICSPATSIRLSSNSCSASMREALPSGPIDTCVPSASCSAKPSGSQRQKTQSGS